MLLCLAGNAGKVGDVGDVGEDGDFLPLPSWGRRSTNIDVDELRPMTKGSDIFLEIEPFTTVTVWSACFFFLKLSTFAAMLAALSLVCNTCVYAVLFPGDDVVNTKK